MPRCTIEDRVFTSDILAYQWPDREFLGRILIMQQDPMGVPLILMLMLVQVRVVTP